MQDSDVYAQVLKNVRAAISAEHPVVQNKEGDVQSKLGHISPNKSDLPVEETLDGDSTSELSTDVEESEVSEGNGSSEKDEDEVSWPLSEWKHQLEIPEALHPSSSSKEMLGARAISSKTARAPPTKTVQQRKSKPEEGWFDIKEKTITDSVKRDWRLLRLRASYDPKRFYKSFDSTKIPKKFQMGTIIEGAGEFYSARLTKKERKATLTEELLADINLKKERKRRYEALQQERQELARKRKKIRALHKRNKKHVKH